MDKTYKINAKYKRAFRICDVLKCLLAIVFAIPLVVSMLCRIVLIPWAIAHDYIDNVLIWKLRGQSPDFTERQDQFIKEKEAERIKD